MLAALVLGVLFLLLFTVGFSLINNQLRSVGVSKLQLGINYNLLVMAGFYVIHFLTIMLAIFAPVDTISGEIASHTIQAIVTKPVRRWEVLFGKWLGYAGMITLYMSLLGGGIDRKLDMIYLMMEQTQNERTRITPAFKKIVYDAFAAD